MAAEFKITFDAPVNKEGVVELVIDENAIQSESEESTSGPLTKVTSPAIAIDTRSVSAIGPTSPSAPDAVSYTHLTLPTKA